MKPYLGKRSLDFSGALFAALLFSPLFILIPVLLLVFAGRPILFIQERIGQRKRPFLLYKFRTMRTGVLGAPITASNDVRIFPLGAMLRKTKFDELPQIWNVLRGDMSLVGPRPEIPKYLRAYSGNLESVLDVKPGLTDLATLHFISEEEILAASSDPEACYEELILPRKLEMNLKYVESQSLMGDLKILLFTAMAVLRIIRFGDHHV